MSEGTAFGAWLKLRRKGLDLTRKELARRVGCSIVTIEKIEAGERKPSHQIAELLAKSLGVQPNEGPAFLDFARADIPAGRYVGLAQQGNVTPWRALRRPANNLPFPPTPFIGRRPQVEAAISMLRRPGVRLLTMTGPPGIGKTRLSLQVAQEILDDPSAGAGRSSMDGVFFVALATIRDPDLVTPRIAQVLGVKEEVGQSLLDSVKAYLRERHMLLVFDNFEQVIPAASVVSELLLSSRWLQILVTSREALHLYGEREFAVPPLTIPEIRPSLPSVEYLTSYEAITLFSERAEAVCPDFVLTAENAESVVQICARLEGMPLAIELAAAQVKFYTPQDILLKLERKLDLLTGGPIDLPARQQALRTAIDWSYDLLDQDERRLFKRMSVFAGGCTEEAASRILDFGFWILDSESSAMEETNTQNHALERSEGPKSKIQNLVNKSLLRSESDAEQPRFMMLETIHEYAWEILEREEYAEVEILQRRHADYYLAFAEEAEPQLKGPDQIEWLDRLEREHDNLRAALAWSIEYGEAEMALRLSGALWRFWLVHGHLTEGRNWLEKALELGSNAPAAVRAAALVRAGNLAHSCGDYPAADAFYSESLLIRRELGDKRGIAGVLNNLALVAHAEGDYPRVMALHQESLALKRELGDRWGIASSLGNLGVMAQDQGDYALAHSLHEESLVVRRELGDKLGVALALNNLGAVAFARENYEEAHAFHDESLAMRQDLGDKQGVAESLINLGDVARGRGDHDKANALYKESLEICQELGDRAGTANVLVNMAFVAHAKGSDENAAELFGESLALRRQLGEKRGVAECLAGLASVSLSQGQPERAAILFGATEALLNLIDFRIRPLDRARFDRDAVAARTALGETAWTRAWTAGQKMGLEQAVSYALKIED